MQSSSSGHASRSYSGPVLAPIAIPGPPGGRSAQHHNQHQHQVAPHTHIAPSQHSPGPLAPPSDVNARRVSTSIDRLLSDRHPSYSSPASSTFPPPASFNFDQRGEFGTSRRFSTEPSPDRRGERQNTANMMPSPTYTIKRSPDHSLSDEPTYQSSSRFTSNSGDDAVGLRRDLPPNSSAERYQIIVRQQPVAARACGFGERDRRVIDPPPIVQLLVKDPATGIPDPNEMRYPFNVVHCTLWSVDERTDETALIGLDKRLTRRLMGTLVSSPFVGQDEAGNEGCFFCFPDLSCRTHGKYRLRFVLMRLEPSDLQPEGYTPIIATAMSNVFTVYTAKEFPGMRPSTQLTKALKKQGCAISVKKGNEKAVGSAGGDGKDDGSDNEPEQSPSQSAGKPKRRRKG